MTFAPLELNKLSSKHIEQMYETAKNNEVVFRNVLNNISDHLIKRSNKDISYIFSDKTSLEDIFDKIVKNNNIRISDFRIGPFKRGTNLKTKFPEFKSEPLEKNITTTYVELSNQSWILNHKIIKNSYVEQIRRYSHYQL